LNVEYFGVAAFAGSRFRGNDKYVGGDREVPAFAGMTCL
jgi:hypothetical protein